MLQPQILIASAQKELISRLRHMLHGAGYASLDAPDGNALLSQARALKPALIILDALLPDYCGHDLCRELKTDPAMRPVPVVMLSAQSSEQSRISGFEAGAEDYIVAPFNPREFLLRVKAILARTGGNHHPTAPMVTLGLVRLLREERRVFVADAEITLTRTEFDILSLLARAGGRVKSRDQILEAVWGENAEAVLERTVDAQIKRLRAKLGQARHAIETVRGLGYRLIDTEPPPDSTTLAKSVLKLTV